MDGERKVIEVADFAANYSAIIDDLSNGAVPGVDLTQDGELVAVMVPARKSLHGHLRGTVLVPDGFDVSAPVLEDELHAEAGRPHE